MLLAHLKVYDYFGIKVACIVAGVFLCAGYSGIYLAATFGGTHSVLAFCMFLVGQGSHGLYTVVRCY